MRPIAKYVSLFTAAVAITAALPMSGAAAATDAFLKLGDIKGEASGSARIGHEVVVQVESWSWGATQTSARVRKIDSFANKRTADPGGAAAAGGVQVAAGDVNADGRPDVIVADVASPRDAASGTPTGKRQHKPIVLSKPLDRGSLTVKAPAGKCTLGTHYTTATLTTRTMRYELKDAIITSCATGGGGGGGAVPTESISLNYSKIEVAAVPQDPQAKKVQVRGWDPERKEQN